VRAIRVVFCVLLLCALLPAGLSTAAAVTPQATGTIICTVRDAATHEPVFEAHVSLYRFADGEWTSDVQTADGDWFFMTGEDGQVSVDVPAGVYRLGASAWDSPEAYYGGGTDVAEAADIVVPVAGEVTVDLDVPVNSYDGTVRGRVVDDAGEPVANIDVGREGGDLVPAPDLGRPGPQ